MAKTTVPLAGASEMCELRPNEIMNIVSIKGENECRNRTGYWTNRGIGGF